MKGTPTLFLIYLMVLLLAACGGGGESTTSTTSEAPGESTATTTEAPGESSTGDNSDLFAESRTASPTGDKVNTVGKTINRDAVGLLTS